MAFTAGSEAGGTARATFSGTGGFCRALRMAAMLARAERETPYFAALGAIERERERAMTETALLSWLVVF